MKNAPLRRARGKQKEKPRTGMSLEDILEGISDGFFCLDQDLVVTYFNAAAERLLKRKREDILGRKLFDAFPEGRGSVFEEEYTRALRDKKFVSFETHFGVKPYEDWYDVKVHPSEEGLTVFFQVITERKRTEQRIEDLNRSLRHRLSELETIFETVPVGIAIAADTEGRHIRGNPANERLLGLPRGGELSMRARGDSAPAYRVLKGDRPLAVDELPMQRAVRGETVTGETFTVIRTDGSVVELLCNAVPLLDEEGRPRGAVGVFQDITELKRAEERILHLASFPQLNPSPVIETDGEGKVTFYNAATAEALGTLLREEDVNAFLPSDVQDILLMLRQARGARSLLREVHVGSRVFAESIYLSAELGVMRIYASDITARKQAEDALRLSEQKLHLALQASGAEAWGWNVKDNILDDWTPQYRQLYGFRADDPVGFDSWLAHVHPDDRQRLTDRIERILDTPGDDTWDEEFRILHPQRGERWLGGLGRCFRDESGRALRMAGVNFDITDRKKVEEALRASEQRIQQALRVSRSFTFEWEPDTDQVLRSASCGTILRLTGDEVCSDTGERFFRRIHPDDRARFVEILRNLNPGRSSYTTEYRVLCGDGGVAVLEETGQGVFDNNGKMLRLVGVSTDITARKQAEESLRWAARRDQLLSDTAGRLLRSDDPQGIVEELCRQVMDFLGCQVFFNYMVDEREERLHLNAWAGIAEEEAREIRWLDYGTAVCGSVARDRERIIAEDILNTPDPRTALAKSHGFQAYCCHPLMVQDRLIGTLSFGSRTQTHFKAEQVEVMNTVADLVAIAMHRIKTEAALLESREDLDRAQSVGQIGSWRMDVRHNVLTWSDENHRIFGVDRGTPLTYESFLATIHPEDREYVDMMWREALRGEPYDIEHRIVADGRVKWVREKAYLEFEEGGALIGGFGITQDITERKKAEAALRESEASLRSAREALQEANEELEYRIKERTRELRRTNRDLEQRTYDLNERVKELNCLYTVSHLLTGEAIPLVTALQKVVNMIPSGFQYPEIAGAGIVLNSFEVKTDNYSDTPWKLWRPISIGGTVRGMIKVAYCKKPPVPDSRIFLHEEEGLIETLAELIGDFVDRLRSRTMLEESETRYRRISRQLHALFDAIPDVLVLVSADLQILWANRAAAAQMRVTSEDFAGKTCDDLWAGLAGGADSCPARACFRSGQQEAARFGTLWNTSWDIKVIPVKDEDGTVVNVIIDARDITGELRLQEEAIRSARLASLGELAAGVAHEINNPINSVINYAQILASKADLRREEHEFAEEIVREGERIAAIVRGLLGFARETRDIKQPTTLHSVLTSTLVLTNAQLKRDGIRLRIDIPDDLPPVRANRQQLQQVFLNLISNARYALNKKFHGPHQDKVLDIRGESRTVDGEPHVCVEVSDHGTGIPKEMLDKVTAPFFTTKPPSEGTGLGLSISRGIVADHGGQLTIESVEGEYTRVMIDLPSEAPEEIP